MPRPGAIASGDWWWALLPIERGDEERELTIELEAKVGLRRRNRQEIGTISVVPGPQNGSQAALALADPPLGAMMGFPELNPTIAICLATRNPSIRRFEHQVNSIRDQTYEDFRCIISDDASSPSRVAEMESVIGGDDRFELDRSSEILGPYRNVERALSLAPEIAPYVALADQDDRWYPHKLEILMSTFETATLMVHSDALRVVGDRPVLSGDESDERERNQDCLSFRSLLLRNSVTGGACMFRRELLGYALPFPPGQGECRHDHWLALVARALGTMRFVDASLYDRLEPAEGGLGSVSAGEVGDSKRRRARLRRRRQRRNWRQHYFDQVAWGLVAGEVLRIRCWEIMRPEDRRTLARFLRVLRATRLVSGGAWLKLRSARTRAQTGGSERLFLRGIVWRRAAKFRARFVREN